MLSIAHIATGSYIAANISNPLLYVPLVLASHYLEDAIPHWDCGTGLGDNSKTKTTAILQELFELGLSIIFIFVITKNLDPSKTLDIYIASCISLVPDFLEAPANFLNWNPKVLKVLNDFHDKFHTDVTEIKMGLTLQLVLIFLVYVFI